MSAPNAPAVPKLDLRPLPNFRFDISAGLVVFLVALPLCLGIALASGAPLFAGLISGIVGGVVIPLISRSALSVSGPAAGLTAIVLAGIATLGSYEKFLLAVVLAGIIQVGLGLLRAGSLGALVPTAVIEGMLAAIGLLLIFKQIPHALGYDADNFSSEAFAGPGGENTFSMFMVAANAVEWGAFAISAVGLVVLFGWRKTPMAKLAWLPSALVVVLLGVGFNWAFGRFAPHLSLGTAHLVELPVFASLADLVGQLRQPAWSALTDTKVYTVAVTIALVASIETLLSIEAVDKLDPFKRQTPTSRELIAQGVANTISGLLGGLPVTSVIVRSSANVTSGGRTRMSAFYHGIFLLLSVLFISRYLNLIPLACLAAVLLQVGYKLSSPTLIKKMLAKGRDQFIPFAVTVLAVLLVDLLRGVILGLVVGLAFTLFRSSKGAFTVLSDDQGTVIRFNKDAYFLHKAALATLLREIPDGSHVRLDMSRAHYIDRDIEELIHEFQESAAAHNLTVLVSRSAVPVPLRTVVQREEPARTAS